MHKMCIIETKLTEEKLRQMILSQDMKFAPMGSGGYAVKEKPDGSSFVFEQQDCHPFHTFFARIKNGDIWVSAEEAIFFMSMLGNNSIPYGTRFKTFRSPEAIRKEFDEAV